MISLIECIKKDSFKWTKAAQRAFELIKVKFCSASILAPSNFKSLFVVKCDANRVGICAVLTQATCPLTDSSEKMNGSRLNYSTQYKEFFAIVRALEQWNHYLKPKPFVLHPDHKALFDINSQHMWNRRLLNGSNSFNLSPSLAT